MHHTYTIQHTRRVVLTLPLVRTCAFYTPVYRTLHFTAGEGKMMMTCVCVDIAPGMYLCVLHVLMVCSWYYIWLSLCETGTKMVSRSGITVPPNGMVPLNPGPRHNVLLYYTIPHYTIPYCTIQVQRPFHHHRGGAGIPYHTIQVQSPFHHHRGGRGATPCAMTWSGG